MEGALLTLPTLRLYPTPPPLPSNLPALPSSTESSEGEGLDAGITLRHSRSAPQSTAPEEFVSSTSRDLLALIRRSQRDLAKTMAGLEQCKQTTQETKRICLLLGLSSEGEPFGSSSEEVSACRARVERCDRPTKARLTSSHLPSGEGRQALLPFYALFLVPPKVCASCPRPCLRPCPSARPYTVKTKRPG